jgi:hypothetical protein
MNTARDREACVGVVRCGCHAGLVEVGEPVRQAERRLGMLLRRGRILEGITLGWNVAGIVVLAAAAVAARSVALAGFGLDSVIEVGASTVVLWELAGTGEDRVLRAAGDPGDFPGRPLCAVPTRAGSAGW